MADTVVTDTHASGDDPNRRDFIHIAAGAAAVGAVAALAWPFIDQMNPAGDGRIKRIRRTRRNVRPQEAETHRRRHADDTKRTLHRPSTLA